MEGCAGGPFALLHRTHRRPLRTSAIRVARSRAVRAVHRRIGGPALELACGDGDPILELRRRGLDVEGLDASPDMLERCRRAAAEHGVDVVLHHQTMESMTLPRRYRSIFLAGASFNLLADDDVARRALERICAHLAEGGSALIPLHIPAETKKNVLGRPRESTRPDGSVLRVTPLSQAHDEVGRTQTTVMRYEIVEGATTQVLERPWLLQWHTQAGFRELAASAGLETNALLDTIGALATESADVFVFWLVATP
ncbi:MAG: class I SAM-dependent methyltransferase [Acidimicrobiia bacterium]